ncbi:MAG: RadC family protein [Clostridia bacterium]|nr:RadC family protein [Clostridia bacterium]
MEKKNIHDGHRARLKEKFKKYEEMLSDHEILELILGYSIKRKDTNALAHSLINKFGGLKNVFSQPVDVLTSIDGIGEHTAIFLNLLGTSLKRADKNNAEKDLRIYTIEEAKKRLISLFKDAKTEVFYALFLNRQNKVTNIVKVESNSATNVSIDAADFTKSIILNKPASVIIAHNHFATFPYPSDEDDKTTANIYTLLRMYGVNLYDHIIVSGTEVFSYFYDNRLQDIKDKINKQLF